MKITSSPLEKEPLLSLKNRLISSSAGEEEVALVLRYVQKIKELIAKKQENGAVFFWKDLPWVIQFWPVISFFYEDRDLINFLNPCPEVGGMSGLIGYSKKDLHETFPRQFLPKTLNFQQCPSEKEVINQMKQDEMKFPVFCKPDVGERSAGVRRVNSSEELRKYLSVFPQNRALIVQHPAGAHWEERFEYGVQVVRIPKTECLEITSAELKSLPFVLGDGKESVDQLVKNLSELTTLQRENVLSDLSRSEKEFIPAVGKKVFVVHAASVSRGTQMVSLKTDFSGSVLEKKLEEILSGLSDFSSGRFDLVAPSEAALVNGDFEIIEGNAGAAIPLQVYRTDLSVEEVYDQLFSHFLRLRENAQKNHEKYKKKELESFVPMSGGKIAWHLSKSLLQQREQMKGLASADTQKMLHLIRKSARAERWEVVKVRTKERMASIIKRLFG